MADPSEIKIPRKTKETIIPINRTNSSFSLEIFNFARIRINTNKLSKDYREMLEVIKVTKPEVPDVVVPEVVVPDVVQEVTEAEVPPVERITLNVPLLKSDF